MKKIFFLQVLCICSTVSFAQNIDKIINAAEVERIEKVLSADDMHGRKTFSPDIDRAADFIAGEFAKNKLAYFNGSNSYLQEFIMTKSKPSLVEGTLDEETLNEKNVAANSTAAEINITDLKDYEVVAVKAGDDFSKIVFPGF